MEQQLQSEIKKNKNLLQSNFTLMEENQQCVAALTKLKKYFLQFSHQDQDDEQFDENVTADDADAFVDTIIDRIKHFKEEAEGNRFDKTEQKKAGGKQDECEKWKNLYVKESQESYRLSKKIVELEETVNRMEEKNQLQGKEMDRILKQYLVLFRKVNSFEFLQDPSQSDKRGKEKDYRETKQVKQNKNENVKNSKQKQKRSASKTKSASKVSSKKAAKNPQENIKNDKNVSDQSIPFIVLDELSDFPNLTQFLESLRNNCGQLQLENKMLRQTICENETLIRIYRHKERERILYGQFLVE